MPAARRRRPPLLASDAQERTWADRLGVARKLTQIDPRLGDWVMQYGRYADPPATEILRIAQEMGVDPRWLATGEPSPASIAAVTLLRLSGYGDSGDAGEPDEALQVAELIPQPPAPECTLALVNTCRYCGCTDQSACEAGCSWIDDACTICSACLSPGGQTDAN